MMGYWLWAFTGCGNWPLLLGIFIICFLFIYFKKKGSGRKEPLNFQPDALEQLNLRLAKGEISIEEYQNIKNTLLK